MTTLRHSGMPVLSHTLLRSKALRCSLALLKSRRAIQVNIQIMQTFVRLRAMIVNHIDLARRLDALERKYDAQFKAVFDAIREMMIPPERTRCKIGFLAARNP